MDNPVDVQQVRQELHSKKRNLGVMYYKRVPIQFFTKTDLLMILWDCIEEEINLEDFE